MAKTKEESKPAVDEVAEQLKRLGAELMAAAEDVDTREAKLHEVEAFLGKLTVKDFPDLAESPVVQSFVQMLGGGDLQPGQTARRGTLAERTRDWTWRDLDQFPKVMFTPRETIPLTWNGLSVQLVDDVEVTLPKPFHDIYQEHRRAIQQAARHEAYLMGKSDQPPDPNWLTDESARVRAWSIAGRPYGKMSATLTVGRIADVEGEAAPAEEEKSG